MMGNLLCNEPPNVTCDNNEVTNTCCIRASQEDKVESENIDLYSYMITIETKTRLFKDKSASWWRDLDHCLKEATEAAREWNEDGMNTTQLEIYSWRIKSKSETKLHSRRKFFR